MIDRTQCHARLVLRSSTVRILEFVEQQIEGSGTDSVVLFPDQFEVSRATYLPALSELSALGLVEWIRMPKRHQVRLSSRWRMIETQREALLVSARARTQRAPPQQPATASISAQA